MDLLEELLSKRYWNKHCLRANIVPPEKIQLSGTFKLAMCETKTPRKQETKLIELISSIAPEWGPDSSITLNRNVQCERHKDGNDGQSWILWLGDFTGGALVFDDGTRIEEKYKWHQIDGRQYHWNEPHEGTKYAIIVYTSTKIKKGERMTAARYRRKGRNFEC